MLKNIRIRTLLAAINVLHVVDDRILAKIDGFEYVKDTIR